MRWDKLLLVACAVALTAVWGHNALGLTLRLSLDGVTAAPDEIDVSPDDMLEMYVVSYAYDPEWSMVISAVSPLVIENVVPLPGAGDLATVVDSSHPSFWDPAVIQYSFGLTAKDSTGVVPPGTQFGFDIRVAEDAVLGEAHWLYLEAPGLTADMLTVNVVPEPGTVALLSLGGLVAFRRRRSR